LIWLCFADRVSATDCYGFFNRLTGPKLLDVVEAQLPEHRERLYTPTLTLFEITRMCYARMPYAIFIVKLVTGELIKIHKDILLKNFAVLTGGAGQDAFRLITVTDAVNSGYFSIGTGAAYADGCPVLYSYPLRAGNSL